MAQYSLLPWRGILEISGPDRISFLQGLLTNDLTKATPPQEGRATGLWAALLTPQGKVLHELFVVETGDSLWLDAEADRLDELATRLKRYKLRAKIEITPRPDLAVAQIFEGIVETLPALAFADPRHPQAGTRVIAPADTLTVEGAPLAPVETWNLYRRRLALPDGAEDTGIDAFFALEIGMHDHAGVDFHKGCYVGQETTARMKYRSLLKKRLMAVRVDGEIPELGATLLTADGNDAGTFRAATRHNDETVGLAMIRLDQKDQGPFKAGISRLTVV